MHARRDRTIVAIEEAGSDTFRLPKVESGASASQKTFGARWSAWLLGFVKVDRVWQIPVGEELVFGRHSSCRVQTYRLTTKVDIATVRGETSQPQL